MMGAHIRTWLPIIGVVACVAAMRLLAPVLPPAVLPVLLVVGIAAMVALVAFYWRGLDEAAREAQKAAWLWGSTAGVVVWTLLAALAPQFIRWSIAAPFGETADPGHIYLSGAMSILILQCIGFVAYWLIWWARTLTPGAGGAR